MTMSDVVVHKGVIIRDITLSLTEKEESWKMVQEGSWDSTS